MKNLRLLGMSDNQTAKRTFILDFCSLPKKLYSSKDNMEDPSTMKSLLEGTHPLSTYFQLAPFIVYDGKRPVGRFAITSYEADTTAYLGFFECINDKAVSEFLFEKAEQYCRDKGFSVIEGPVNASFWVGYRLKINRFDVAPYTGEPYNKDYYYDLFLDAGFKVSEHYTSNLYRSIDGSYVNDAPEYQADVYLYITSEGRTETITEIIGFDPMKYPIKSYVKVKYYQGDINIEEGEGILIEILYQWPDFEKITKNVTNHKINKFITLVEFNPPETKKKIIKIYIESKNYFGFGLYGGPSKDNFIIHKEICLKKVWHQQII